MSYIKSSVKERYFFTFRAKSSDNLHVSCLQSKSYLGHMKSLVRQAHRPHWPIVSHRILIIIRRTNGHERACSDTSRTIGSEQQLTFASSSNYVLFSGTLLRLTAPWCRRMQKHLYFDHNLGTYAPHLELYYA